jgi:hypothetical protein
MDIRRRDFVRKAAAGALFAAPVVRSLAAPDGLHAQTKSCNPGKTMNVKCNVVDSGPVLKPPPKQQGPQVPTATPLPTAPWQVRPGGTPPGSPPGK